MLHTGALPKQCPPHGYNAKMLLGGEKELSVFRSCALSDFLRGLSLSFDTCRQEKRLPSVLLY